MQILHLDSSIRGDASVSRPIARHLVDKLRAQGDARVVYRDIAHSLPLIDAATVGAYFTRPEERSAGQKAAIALSDELVDELEAADVIVAAVPMYNFGVSAGFKAWIDLVARVGRTFRYTDSGASVGLLEGKTFYAVIATGGTPLDSKSDFVTPYLRRILEFIGITDVHVVAADQHMPDADAKLKLAREAADKLVAQTAAA